MASFLNFGSSFRPVQPTIDGHKDVTYLESPPTSYLANHIYCFWELKTKNCLGDAFAYKVVADGCIDLFFDIYSFPEIYIMGIASSYTEFLLPSTFHYIGIRFLPTVFPLLFQIDAHELTNRFELVNDVVPTLQIQLSEIISRQLHLHYKSNKAEAGAINTTNSIFEILKEAFNTFFTSLALAQNSLLDKRLFHAIKSIIDARGTLNIERDLDVALSSRQLRRLFSFYIGESPKTFSKIVRFQNILHAKPSLEDLRKNKLFFNAGYYDQAHFIKEFKNMYGLLPSKALK
ncbi:AraC family transcriptional regulator [Olivibacter sp. SDN3]|uniref:AraC family transcriptional regulator n=1 Tax=Olivibacter sp. SDN3 TaxID=2764720 RepID=UPI001651A935|nr:helix-turn-helix domain-containing protein [Olivibacter sp. SDN3]QNL48408.1 AraC family transcriptional regulator [Olivibacter sp. SDN3]